MILEKPLMANDCVTVRLTDGTEIIAKYMDSNANGYKLQNVFTVQVQMDHHGNASVGCSPLMLTMNPKSTVEIMKTSVVAMHKSDDQHPIVQEYRKQTTGIQTASVLPQFQLT